MSDTSSEWWQRMIAKHGSEKAVRKLMRDLPGERRAHGKGGFKYMREKYPDRHKEISSKGGRITKEEK